MKPEARILRYVARRIDWLDKIRTHADAAFEYVDDPRLCVRRLEVAEHVARELGATVSTRLMRALVVVARGLRWEPVSNGNRRLFRRVKLRSLTLEEALERSKENRFDARWSKVA